MLDGAASLLTADAKAPGGIEGTGPVVIVDHTTDNVLMAFRFKHAAVKMMAAEEDFEAGGRKFRAGAFIIPAADRAVLEPTMKALGIVAQAATAPTVAMHDLDVPRIGYVHAWSNTQNEGWVRAALDTYGVPDTYFGDIKPREGNLRQTPRRHHLSARWGQRAVAGRGTRRRPDMPLLHKKTAETPNLGVQDQADDIRGGMGWEGLMELVKFVREGGTLTEGSTSTIFPDYKITPGVTVETPEGLFVRGLVMRGVVADRRSPIAYGARRAGAGISARTWSSTPAVAALADSAAGEAR